MKAEMVGTTVVIPLQDTLQTPAIHATNASTEQPLLQNVRECADRSFNSHGIFPIKDLHPVGLIELFPTVLFP